MPVPLAGAILAGGRGRRLGDRDKALTPLVGRPLLQHVIERIAPQVAELVLCVERRSDRYECFGLAQVADPAPGHRGPLGGLLAALRHHSARREWVLLAPCDAPFLPSDLGAVLYATARAADAHCAMVRHAGELQPTFSLWHRCLLPELERAVVRDGHGGFKQFVRAIDVAEHNWPVSGDDSSPPPFFNINDQKALSEAARWLGAVAEARFECSV
jgi:molybdopterin-guanine dinucleotide biosynthesis protein A